VAKTGNLASRFGGILDSCCDRISDAALFAGLGLYFAWMPDVPAGGARQANLTLLALVFLGTLWAFLTSYIKARAENSVPSCGGGFWQRGERVVTFFVGLVFVNPTMIVWILGLWPVTTVAHRLWRAHRASALVEAGQSDAVATLQPRGLPAILLWRWDRHGLLFDVHIGVPILMLAIWKIPATFDPLRQLLEGR
jgi:phosphatidylglycerophosphate synthase